MANQVVTRMSMSPKGNADSLLPLVLFSRHVISYLVDDFRFMANESKLLVNLQNFFNLAKDLG